MVNSYPSRRDLVNRLTGYLDANICEAHVGSGEPKESTYSSIPFAMLMTCVSTLFGADMDASGRNRTVMRWPCRRMLPRSLRKIRVYMRKLNSADKNI